MDATHTTTEPPTHLTESLWATSTVCGLTSDGSLPASIWTEDTTCQDCLGIAHAVRGALTADEAAEPRRILVRNDTIVTIPVADDAQRIIATFWKDSLPALAELLEPVGLNPADIALPIYHQALFTDSQL